MTQNEPSPATSSPAASPSGSRLISLDALRGFDMFWIIGADGLVHALNNVGGNHGVLKFFSVQMSHSDWVGFHFYDLIFPLFAFMVGISLVLSLDKIIAKEGMKAAHIRLFRRFVLLYLVGIFYYGGFSHHWHPADQSQGIRLVGVLPRLAICYFVAGLLYCHLRLRGLVVVFATIMIGYWALMAFVPAPKPFYTPGPGQPRVSFGPGENLANYIDNQYLPGRKWTTSADGKKHYDPEGLLSSIPAVSSALVGVFVALFLKNKKFKDRQKVIYLAAVGLAMVLFGFGWGMAPWPLYFPVIKKIWTSSYVFVAGGYSCLLLAAFYLVVDIWKFRRWAQPFIWIGSNALTMYLVDRLVDMDSIARRFVGGDIEAYFGHYGDILVTVVSLLLFFVVARFLFKRKIFLRL